jgi:chorismate synthase
MNTFGRLFRVSIFGESHGQVAGITIDGCPAGLPLSVDDFIHDLSRRKSGVRGTTSRTEPDIPRIMSGLFEGRTTGAPMTILFENNDVDSSDYVNLRMHPRPGHADFVARKKYNGFNDYRGGGHLSGRLTVALTAAGVVAKKLIMPVHVGARILEAGGSKDIDAAIDKALSDNDSVGGLIECIATDVPAGLGEPFFDAAESLISHLVFAIPGIKGIEFGSGFAAASMTGSRHNDVILSADGTTATNHAGGINGGITNGNELVFRVAVKPTSSIGKMQRTYDFENNTVGDLLIKGRHDACFALRVPPVVEAAVAIVLADLMLINRSIKNPENYLW